MRAYAKPQARTGAERQRLLPVTAIFAIMKREAKKKLYIAVRIGFPPSVAIFPMIAASE